MLFLVVDSELHCILLVSPPCWTPEIHLPNRQTRADSSRSHRTFLDCLTSWSIVGILRESEGTSPLGGSWFTGSLYFNDFATIPDLVHGNSEDLSGWLLDLDLFLLAGFNILDDRNTLFFQSIVASVAAKAWTEVCVVDCTLFLTLC